LEGDKVSDSLALVLSNLCFLLVGAVAGFYLTGSRGLHSYLALNLKRLVRRHPYSFAFASWLPVFTVALVYLDKVNTDVRLGKESSIALIGGLTGVLGTLAGSFMTSSSTQAAAKESQLGTTLAGLQRDLSSLALWFQTPISRDDYASLLEHNTIIESIGSHALLSLDGVLLHFARELQTESRRLAEIKLNWPNEWGEVLVEDERAAAWEAQHKRFDAKVGALNNRIRELLAYGPSAVIVNEDEAKAHIHRRLNERDKHATT
jgi:hypothetical protein